MKKTYFISDLHLGAPNKSNSLQRELKMIRWLQQIEKDAESIYILGDLFDFWFEYKKVIPKGYIRLLGKLAELKDKGINIHFFTGNHDMWMFRYLSEELNIPIHHQPISINIHGKQFYLAHGDGLGPGDYAYKFLKKIFSNSFFQFLFRWIHPDIGISLANFWSKKSRKHTKAENQFFGAHNEWLLQHCLSILDTHPADYYVFGHRHFPMDIQLKNLTSRYINLGEWLQFYSYAVFDGSKLTIHFFEDSENKQLFTLQANHY